MIEITKKAIFLLLLLLSMSSLALGQDIPAVTAPAAAPPSQGFSLPTTQSTLTYSVTGSESLRTGYYGSGATWSSSLSADVGYISGSTRSPTSFVASGGYVYSNSGSGGQPSSFYESAKFSQVLNFGRWNLVTSDTVRYTPETPSTGLSGLPGQGDVGIPSPDPQDDILTRFGSRISNAAIASISRPITGATSLNGAIDYSILRFLNSNDSGSSSLENNQTVGSGGLTHRINARSSANLSYSYSLFSYPSQQYSFGTQGLTVGYSRQWTRNLSVSVSAGPQLTSSSGTPAGVADTSGTGTVSPSSSGGHLSLSASGNIDYQGEFSTTSASYTHGIRTGSGVVAGTISDNAHVFYHRAFGRWTSSTTTLTYSRNSSLVISPTAVSFETISAAFQLSRSISRHISGFAGYTALTQSQGGSPTTTNAFTGLSNVISFGISYSPQPLHFGHK